MQSSREQASSAEASAKRGETGDPVRHAMRLLMAVFYIGAGVLHLAAPDPFLLITPEWVPYPHAVIILTGLCEIAGGIGLLTARSRKAAGIMLALYAACVVPANIKHAVDGIAVPGLPQSWWYHGPRLAFQPVLIWWALFCTGVIDWPRQPRARSGKPKAARRAAR